MYGQPPSYLDHPTYLHNLYYHHHQPPPNPNLPIQNSNLSSGENMMEQNMFIMKIGKVVTKARRGICSENKSPCSKSIHSLIALLRSGRLSPYMIWRQQSARTRELISMKSLSWGLSFGILFKEKLHVRIQSLRLHLSFINQARPLEISTLNKCFLSKNEHVKGSSSGIPECIKPINTFINCFVEVWEIITLYDLETAICKNEGVNQYEELELGPLIQHPLVIRYFRVSSDSTGVFKISREEIVDYLIEFMDTHKGIKVGVEKLLDFIAKKRSVDSKEKLHVRIQSLRLHLSFINQARPLEISTLNKCFLSKNEHMKGSSSGIPECIKPCRVEKEHILSQLREKAYIYTNHGHKRLADVPIRFGKNFGNPFDMSKLVSGTGMKWFEIDIGYLKHPVCQSLSKGSQKWRKFLRKLGVSDFVKIVEVKKGVWDSQELTHLLSHISSKGDKEKSKYLLK
nr:histidine kinase-, DNA gyrase B-, and HSP90-like ATPase family protein [Tanacetum cinerariifolium]